MTHDVDRAEDGERLRRARIRAGLTQAALGERSGVSRQTVAAIETGRHAPSVVAALAIARVLGASVEDLFGVGGDVPAIVRVRYPSRGPVCGSGGWGRGWWRVRRLTIRSVRVDLGVV
ncbi:MAG: helix-turn-helix transcriptional regulator [Solirubrobacterales bacterium]